MKNIKRLFWKLVVSAIILYLLSIRFADVSVGIPLGQHPLEAGWEHMGLVVNEVTLEGWSRVSTSYESMETLKGRMENLVRTLRLKQVAQPAYGEHDSFRYLNMEGILPDGSRGLVSLQTLRIGKEAETHLGFILSRPQQFKDFQHAVEDYEEALKKAGLKGPIGITMTGVYPGRLGEREIQQIFGRCFRALDARRVDGDFVKEYCNWLGRTRKLPGKTTTGWNSSNLEASAVYDSKRNATVVTLATPGVENV